MAQHRQTRMWANAQRDGRPTEHRWRPLFNAAKFVLTPGTRCRAVTLPTTGSISAVSRPKFTILWGHVEDISLLNKFFPIVDTCLSCEDIARHRATIKNPLPSNRHHRRNGDCLEGKIENYQVCSVQYCAQQSYCAQCNAHTYEQT